MRGRQPPIDDQTSSLGEGLAAVSFLDGSEAWCPGAVTGFVTMLRTEVRQTSPSPGTDFD